MARLPLEPCLAKTLLEASRRDCLQPAAAMCAMAAGEDPYCRAGRPQLLEAAMATRERLDGPNGDHASLLALYAPPPAHLLAISTACNMPTMCHFASPPARMHARLVCETTE